MNLVFGTNRRVSAKDVRNSLYFISDKGKLAKRYDKRFCTLGDLRNYNPGNEFATFNLNGFKCGLIICYDVRFPELYRGYAKRNVKLMFHSFYNARAKKANIHTTIMRVTMQGHAASNFMYISGNNSSGYYQSWPSVFINPNGEIVNSCPRHRSGMIINEISDKDKYYDASGPFRKRALAGKLSSR